MALCCTTNRTLLYRISLEGFEGIKLRDLYSSIPVKYFPMAPCSSKIFGLGSPTPAVAGVLVSEDIPEFVPEDGFRGHNS